jgi:hypothetical protein
MENFFSSPALLYTKATIKINCCGAVCPTCKGMLHHMQNGKTEKGRHMLPEPAKASLQKYGWAN